jgi:hypothetical protein
MASPGFLGSANAGKSSSIWQPQKLGVDLEQFHFGSDACGIAPLPSGLLGPLRRVFQDEP